MRGLNAEILGKKANAHGLFGGTYDSVKAAFKAARKQASKKDVIFIGGSNFTVAEVI